LGELKTDKAGPGVVRRGLEGRGWARQGMEFTNSHDWARHGEAQRGRAWYGLVWQGVSSFGFFILE
jgi:hypothetical protein